MTILTADQWFGIFVLVLMALGYLGFCLALFRPHDETDE